MTSFRIERGPFTDAAVKKLGGSGDRHTNWPIVYVLNDAKSVYVGETLNAAKRMRQHRDPASRNRAMREMRIVLDDRFNKSACLDLESQLIRYFSGDGTREVRNRNDGVTDADYYERHTYTQSFDEIFAELRRDGLFSKSRHEIENSDLFKLSPFKALAPEQSAAVENILEGLFDDRAAGRSSTSVVQGAAGTGKTIVAIYLMKLLRDIGESDAIEAYETDSVFADFFRPGYREYARDLRIGLVIPQGSLRASVAKVFKRTPGLSKTMVMSAFDVGKSVERFDLLLVDESHRLTRRSNQPSAALNTSFAEINRRLFGDDDPSKTQLDWICAQSDHQVLFVDSGQSVRPSDISRDTQRSLLEGAERGGRLHKLMTQMRVKAGTDYVGYVRAVLSGESPVPIDVGDYDVRFFDDPRAMREAILRRDADVGLARMLGGYGYKWRSKTDSHAYDIEIGDFRMRWNVSTRDWINSRGSADEVGSIHTVQGYDLNYAGVIIGPEVRWDHENGRIRIDRANYFDGKGKENSPKYGVFVSDDDLRELVINIYVVLLTRGMRGTYVYVHDGEVRERLRGAFEGIVRTAR